LESEWSLTAYNAGMINLRGTPAAPRPHHLICGYLDGIMYTNWHLMNAGPATQTRMNFCTADGRITDYGVFFGVVLGGRNFPFGLPLIPAPLVI